MAACTSCTPGPLQAMYSTLCTASHPGRPAPGGRCRAWWEEDPARTTGGRQRTLTEVGASDAAERATAGSARVGSPAAIIMCGTSGVRMPRVGVGSGQWVKCVSVCGGWVVGWGLRSSVDIVLLVCCSWQGGAVSPGAWPLGPLSHDPLLLLVVQNMWCASSAVPHNCQCGHVGPSGHLGTTPPPPTPPAQACACRRASLPLPLALASAGALTPHSGVCVPGSAAGVPRSFYHPAGLVAPTFQQLGGVLLASDVLHVATRQLT